MIIEFPRSLVLEARQGTSKSGNPYCVLRFLDEESLEVYDMMQFGDSAAAASGLGHGSHVGLGFELRPDTRNGGLRAELCAVMAYPTDGEGQI